MIYLIWIISLIAIFFLGYHFKGIANRVEVLETAVKLKIDKPKQSEEPKSEVIDPLDPVQTARYEQDKLMKKLNPHA